MRRAIAVGMLLVVAGCPRVDRQEPTDPASDARAETERERRAIEASVAGYVDALLARDPAAAATWVTAGTFEFYDRLRELALTAKRSELEQRYFMEIYMVLELRSRLPRSELEQADGRALFDAAIAAGMAAEALTPDDVWIDEAAGRAEVRIDGETVLWLAREQGRWLIDLPAMMPGLESIIETEYGDAIVADGKLRVAYTLLEVRRESMKGLDIAILDGPLDVVPDES